MTTFVVGGGLQLIKAASVALASPIIATALVDFGNEGETDLIFTKINLRGYPTQVEIILEDKAGLGPQPPILIRVNKDSVVGQVTGVQKIFNPFALTVGDRFVFSLMQLSQSFNVDDDKINLEVVTGNGGLWTVNILGYYGGL